jgi:hypothetical protein
MPPIVEPNWPQLTRAHHKKRVEQFSANLKAVASSFASHQRVDSTSVIHVDEAHTALATAGLAYEKWYRRPEFEVGTGSLLIGVALSAPTIGAFIFSKNADHAFVLTVVLMCVGFVLGLIFSIHGWVRGRLPPPLPHIRRNPWKCWPWSSCAHLTQGGTDPARPTATD